MTFAPVLTCADRGLLDPLATLLGRFGLQLVLHPDDTPLPGSWWGEPEAGITGCNVHARPDTPIHSVLHETSHLICMDSQRRARVHANAGGTELEECAVCYLQILLADALPAVGRHRLMRDMDCWGYSFRLGSTETWFRLDATDARGFLQRHGLVDAEDRLTFACRGSAVSMDASDATLRPI
ncbi:MAG: hypothetical protein KGY40_04925 [Thioalkalivibrio sp.]|nr:hypothetical protein [Thioalkalivibrio sp.]